MNKNNKNDKNCKLFFVGTPIGNLEDITYRAVRILKEADIIACEDTRHSRKLLSFYGISTPCISYHEHNEVSRSKEIIEYVLDGRKVAIVSDAGMPGISDPGRILIEEAIKGKIPYTIIPGPSAVVAAYVLSGMSGDFTFIGFLPRKGSDREKYLKKIDSSDEICIIYEAPHRIKKTLNEFSSRWIDRSFCVCREITKQYEETVRFIGSEYNDDMVTDKGEFVVLIGPAIKSNIELTEKEILELLEKELENGLSTKDASQKIALETGWRKNEVYKIATKIYQK